MTTLRPLAAATLLLAAAPTALAAQTKAPAPSEAGETRNPATPTVTSYPAAAAGDGATANGFNLSRWAEDWSSYRDPAKRDDVLDRLKYLPIAGDGDVYLTLSGELRLRVNHTTNPNLRELRAQRQDINRIVAGADLHVGPHLRAFAEIAHGGIGGVELGVPAATLRNDLVLQQAFVEGNVDAAGVAFGVRYGRQEFTDGPNLLVSQRDNNTIRYTLNGWRAWARSATLRADLFDMKPTAYGDLGTEDDVSDPARRFSGVTLGIVVPPDWFGGSKLYVDPFFWRRRNDVGAWGGRIGPAERFYAGTRIWGDAGPLTIDWSVNHQFGTYIDQDIDAWQVFLAQTYRLGKAKTAPRAGFHFDYASGGGGYGEGKLRNAYAPFGNNIYYSYQLFLTPSNLITAAPNLTFSPVRNLRLTAEYQFAWRDDVRDAVYRANGQPFAGTQNFRSHKIAEVARLQAVWSITPRLSVTGRYEHLAAGPALTDAGYKSSDFLAGWISFRF
ncbi:alginate export family protein [Sphingomonas sp. KR1UV-12]|uniref:Alginate export family protein n=1 Tax=Sphingomonas aurea TaxID=3063994 RepID=A0ABT9ENF7_9SPHN|nr:alginate export family protein [Sphingomonas sp. KR1UV-12]MDP1028481.1 alginate export family protein [Sphingomonas sp. KR1UV-12]